MIADTLFSYHHSLLPSPVDPPLWCARGVVRSQAFGTERCKTCGGSEQEARVLVAFFSFLLGRKAFSELRDPCIQACGASISRVVGQGGDS